MITFSNLGKLGRLGNQLFQVASTLGIAHRNKQMAVFPQWSYADYFAQPLPQGDLFNCQLYKVVGASYRPINLPSGNWNLSGFFQSEKYFIDIESEIRKQFAPAPDVLLYIGQKYGSLLEKQPCSIHVRRGDYLQLSSAFPTQSLAYYQHAISQLPSNSQFLIFSDDISWCRKQFQGTKFTFIENENDIVDLFLMSLCQHHILSNSSFSWWGAWLNPNPDKVVLCPAWWVGPAASMRPKHYARDIYARGFRPLTLPDEHTWLIQLYYIVTSPFYKLRFQAFETKHKLAQKKIMKYLIRNFKSYKYKLLD